MSNLTNEKNEVLEIGMGATFCGYSDSNPYTIIAIKGNTVTLQADNAEQLFKPNFIPGGFSAICTNNHSQEWKITPNPEGAIVKVSKRKNGRFVQSGFPMNGTGGRFSLTGRNKHYDFNF